MHKSIFLINKNLNLHILSHISPIQSCPLVDIGYSGWYMWYRFCQYYSLSTDNNYTISLYCLTHGHIRQVKFIKINKHLDLHRFLVYSMCVAFYFFTFQSSKFFERLSMHSGVVYHIRASTLTPQLIAVRHLGIE